MNNFAADKLKILKNSSQRFYYSTLAFPEPMRTDVGILYSFCRKTDNIVDLENGVKALENFRIFKNEFYSALEQNSSNDVMLNDFIKVYHTYSFKKEWIEALFESMEMDLNSFKYESLEPTLKYVYGVAEVIGLMMAQIMELPEESTQSAMMLGRAMQWSNMIRDIDEDNKRGRCYFPKSDLDKFELKDLEYSTVITSERKFYEFIDLQIERFLQWMEEAEKGYKYIPRNCITAVKTAADIDLWTIEQIRKNPLIIYERKVKPSNFTILRKGLENYVRLSL